MSSAVRLTNFSWYSRSLKCILLATSLLAGCSSDPFQVSEPEDCSTQGQNAYVLNVMEQVYLWNDQLPEGIDPGEFASPEELLAELRYEDDRWSRIADRAKVEAYYKEGKTVGLGIAYGRTVDDLVRIVYVSPGSPAEQAGLLRGDTLLSINGRTIAEIDQEGWKDAFGPRTEGSEVRLEVQRTSGTVEILSFTVAEYQSPSVSTTKVLPEGTQTYGYLLLDGFIEPSYDELNAAFSKFAQEDVNAVIIDLRYNGGGLVGVAEHLINLLVGATSDGISYQISYNENLSSENRAISLEKSKYSLPLDHVVFIATKGTASASELVINAVRAHVPTYIVGEQTYGKPVGSMSYDFCETKQLSPISFRLENADGYGDYFDGLAANCEAGDDIDHLLGDPNENLLSTALVIAQGTAICDAAGEARKLPEDTTRTLKIDRTDEVYQYQRGLYISP